MGIALLSLKIEFCFFGNNVIITHFLIPWKHIFEHKKTPFGVKDAELSL